MQTKLPIRIKKLHPDAHVPSYKTPGSAAFDIDALIEHDDVETIQPGAPLIVRTGLEFEIPEGHVMLLFSRSGQGFKHSVRLANCVGVVDSDYRGEVLVKLTSDPSIRDQPMTVHHGQSVAQGIVLPIPTVEFKVAEQLTLTDRGAAGFGSTDVAATAADIIKAAAAPKQPATV